MSDQTLNKKTMPKPGTARNYANPFPGLRPFGIDENHLFFGREGQSEEVLMHLARNRFVAVIGASGSGKSSLMYCGLVPTLYGGFIADAGSSWKIITTRPGNDPLGNLARSIALEETTGLRDENPEVAVNITEAVIRRNSKGLVNALEHIGLSEGENILLLVDQFEELFRYKGSRKDENAFNDSEVFVRLLVQAVRQKELPVYIVMTMRSDFIGECSQFQELTRLINDSNYLIPQMTRDDLKDAIVGPVAVGGAAIDQNLIQQLLNDVGDNPDQLPILQHALMRTWDHWLAQKDPERPLMITDFDAIGRMEKALSEHANEAYEELDERQKQICESLFKTLTERGGDNRGIRHPTRLEIIAEIARAEVAEVASVIDVFRAPGRSFLTPAVPAPLTPETVIDISHESLMRIWDRLKIWVEEEDQAVQMYNRLAEAAEMYQKGKTGLWRPPDLQLALNWRKKQHPTLTWAERYNPSFERAMVFLETSEKEFIAEEENKIKLQKRQLRRTRIFAIILGSAAIVSLVLLLWTQVLRQQAEKARQLAQEQQAIAVSKSEEAQEQRALAEASAGEAQQQRDRAEEQSEIAGERRIQAEESAAEARRQQAIAVAKSEEAQEQREIAEESAEEANRQRNQAEIAREEAYKRRMLSISQSMAVKSMQVDDDPDMKGLLAYQAYLFNQEYEGEQHNADVYAGLYEAVKMLSPENYNVFDGHSEAVRSIVFAPEKNAFYSAGSDGKILLWNLEDTAAKSRVLAETHTVNRIIDITGDGKWLACGTEGKGIQIYNTTYMEGPVRNLSGHGGRIFCLDFLPDNRKMVTAGPDNRILIWDFGDGRKEELASVGSIIHALQVSPDGRLLAAGTRDGSVLLWELSANRGPDTLFREAGNPVLALAFDQSADTLATGDQQGNIRIWDLRGRKQLINLRGHKARLTDLEFSRDNRLLGSSSNDGSVRLWETGDYNNQPIVMSDNAGFVFSLAFSPDSKKLVSGSTEEDRLVLRPTRAGYLADGICEKLNRNFTGDEWETYVATDIPYRKTCPDYGIGVKKSPSK